MSDSIYSFRAGPTYRPATRAEQFDAALDQPMSLTSTLVDQAKGGILESFGLGTGLRDLTTPQGNTERSILEPLTGMAVAPLPGVFPLLKGAVQSVINEPQPSLSKEQYDSSAFARDGIQWDEGMTEDRAASLAIQYDAKRVREYYAEKRPFSSFVGNLAGQAVDPINYIPIFGPTVKGAAVLRVAGKSALDAAANTAIFGVATAPQRSRYGDDVSWQMIVSEIATAALIGGAFGGIAGALGRRQDAISRQSIEARLSTLKTTQEARIALNEGIDALVWGEDVALSPNATEPMRRVAAEIEATKPQQGGFVSADAATRLGVADDGALAAVRYEGETFIAGDHAAATRMAAAKFGEEAARAIEASPDRHLGYVTDRVDPSGMALIPADHGEMGIPEPKQGVDDRVYAIHRDGEAIGFANIRVDGDVATVRDIYSTETLDSRNSIGTKAVARLMRQFVRENPNVRTIAGERVSGARRGGKHGLAGTGEDVSIRLPQTRIAVDTSPPRPEPIPEGRPQADARIAKPDDYKALAAQYQVDPETGSFIEETDIAQLGIEGRLTDEDAIALADAQMAFEDGASYGEALKSVANCLI